MISSTQAEIRNLSATESRITSAIMNPTLLSDCFYWDLLVRPAGFEPATPCLEGRCSIRLSYGRTRHAR